MVSIIPRVFQVWKNAGLETIGGKWVGVENGFQVRFKLFQVRGGSEVPAVGYRSKGDKKLKNQGNRDLFDHGWDGMNTD